MTSSANIFRSDPSHVGSARALLILFVCSGNTCRSPLAAAMLAARLAQEPALAHVRVASAGTSATAGMPASEGSYLVGLERGLDLSTHAARQLTRALIEEADLILAMSDHHLGRVQALGGGERATTMLRFAGEAGGDIPDPFGGSITRYRETADLFDEAITRIVPRLATSAR